DSSHAEALERHGIVERNDAAHHHRHVVATFLAQALHDVGNQWHVTTRQDRQADHVHGFVDGRPHDLLRREPDALVHHLDAAIAGTHGDLLGTIGMAVEPGFADQQLDAPAELVGDALDLATHVLETGIGLRSCDGAADTGGGTIFPEYLAQRMPPF